jgi:hypothetical protein
VAQAFAVAETDPVGPDEELLRRVHQSHYNASLAVPIQRVAFQPNPQDTDGISVLRRRFSSPLDIDRAGPKPGEYCVAALWVRQLASLELTVRAAKDEDQPAGHAVIPELSLDRCRRDMAKCKEIQRELAKIASDQIVWRPPGQAV